MVAEPLAGQFNAASMVEDGGVILSCPESVENNTPHWRHPKRLLSI